MLKIIKLSRKFCIEKKNFILRQWEIHKESPKEIGNICHNMYLNLRRDTFDETIDELLLK